MLFAVLDFTDFAIIAAIVAVLAGGTAAARSVRPTETGSPEWSRSSTCC
jgi:hypothetical protein